MKIKYVHEGMKILFILLLNLQVFSQNTEQSNNVISSLLIVNPTNTNLGINAGNSGSSNTSIGYEAGDVVVGNFNTFVGDVAGARTTIGANNVFIGAQSGNFNTTGRQNVFLGRSSGISNTNGSNNVFLGFEAGFNNNRGYSNVFIGTQSGKNGFTSRENVFLGAYSGFKNSRGNENVFIGNRSGYENQSGRENTFLGTYSGNRNNGNRNTFLGFYSGLENTIGHDNTIIGYRAGSFLVSGNDNIFLGGGAGVSVTSGNKNVIVGNSGGRYFLGNTSNKFIIHSQGLNFTPLVYGDFATGNISIGSSSTNSFYKLYVDGYAYASGMWVNGQTQGTILRGKTSSISNALDKINTIGTLEQRVQIGNGKQKSTERKSYAFDANKLQKVFPDLVKQDKEQIAINYQGLIPVLVEAIKELKKENEVLQQKLENVISSLPINNASDQNENVDSLLPKGFTLSQNAPNPAINTSIIKYAIPSGYENTASIKVFELGGGRVVKEYTGLKAGEHQILIKKGMLPSGIYSYSLMLNKKVIVSKKMVVK